MLVCPCAPQAIPAASVSTLDPAGSPMWHGYRAEIPAGWRALQPVFCPVPHAPHGSGSPDSLAAVNQGFQRLRVGILLCPREADGREARREFEAGVLPEAAFLGLEGQYLQASPARPAYGVRLLEAPSSSLTSQSISDECLVLLPCVEFPHRPSCAPLPPIMMFVAGVCVYRSDTNGGGA